MICLDSKNVLLEGDACSPDRYDLIAQTATVPLQETIGIDWRILSGNNKYNYIGRVAYRYEIEEEWTYTFKEGEQA